MRAVLSSALLALGCASSPVVITYTPGEGGGILGGGGESQLKSVSITPQAYGRQCFDARIDPDGDIWVTYAVDGSSDWAGVRALPLIIPEVVGAVMAVVGAPMDLIGSLLGVEREPMPAPSALSACSALFED